MTVRINHRTLWNLTPDHIAVNIFHITVFINKTYNFVVIIINNFIGNFSDHFTFIINNTAVFQNLTDYIAFKINHITIFANKSDNISVVIINNLIGCSSDYLAFIIYNGSIVHNLANHIAVTVNNITVFINISDHIAVFIKHSVAFIFSNHITVVVNNRQRSLSSSLQALVAEHGFLFLPFGCVANDRKDVRALRICSSVRQLVAFGDVSLLVVIRTRFKAGFRNRTVNVGSQAGLDSFAILIQAVAPGTAAPF